MWKAKYVVHALHSHFLNLINQGKECRYCSSTLCLLCIVELNNWPYSSELIAALSSAAVGIDLIRRTIFLCISVDDDLNHRRHIGHTK